MLRAILNIYCIQRPPKSHLYGHITDISTVLRERKIGFAGEQSKNLRMIYTSEHLDMAQTGLVNATLMTFRP